MIYSHGASLFNISHFRRGACGGWMCGATWPRVRVYGLAGAGRVAGIAGTDATWCRCRTSRQSVLYMGVYMGICAWSCHPGRGRMTIQSGKRKIISKDVPPGRAVRPDLVACVSECVALLSLRTRGASQPVSQSAWPLLSQRLRACVPTVLLSLCLFLVRPRPCLLRKCVSLCVWKEP